jgi:hypothetical protein
MERVKDLSKIKMANGYVLIEVIMKKSSILSPDPKSTLKPMADYAIVAALSPDITDLNVGDIVLDFRSTEGFTFNKKNFAMIPRMNVKIAVTPENFENTNKGLSKLN